jgi:hypothetical protein
MSAGALRRQLETAAAASGLGLCDLTVLAVQNDPYRYDTHAGHRDGQWFAQQIERFLPVGQIHLRGSHYRLVSSGDVNKPDGSPYINTESNWICLQKVAQAARWLGYVQFDRIADQRNEAPQIFVPEAPATRAWLGSGEIYWPELDELLPRINCSGFAARQPYRIALIGEKSSLKEVLLPIAEHVGGELLLPTGEASDTMIFGLGARAAADGRPAVVLYFSDFDPAGAQMPISVSRKLQALHDLLYPALQIEVHAVALTIDQVRDLDLPSTPLKETEHRADKWRAKYGHEQTEIDALSALRPEVLRPIARDAIAPFFDPTLGSRTFEAESQWRDAAEKQLHADTGYIAAKAEITDLLRTLNGVADQIKEAQDRIELLVDLPPIDLPEPEITAKAPASLFTTVDDYVDATRRMISAKRLENGQ